MANDTPAAHHANGPPAQDPGTVRSNLICPKCGINLHGRPVEVEPTTGICVVHCPDCDRYAALGSEDDASGVWQRHWMAALLLAWMTAIILLVLAMAAIGVLLMAGFADSAARADEIGVLFFVFFIFLFALLQGAFGAIGAWHRSFEVRLWPLVTIPLALLTLVLLSIGDYWTDGTAAVVGPLIVGMIFYVFGIFIGAAVGVPVLRGLLVVFTPEGMREDFGRLLAKVTQQPTPRHSTTGGTP